MRYINPRFTYLLTYCVCTAFREESQNDYSFYLEAAISTSKQVDEDRLTYLNKGLLILAAVLDFTDKTTAKLIMTLSIVSIRLIATSLPI